MYAIVVGDRDTREVLDVIAPVVAPVRHGPGDVSWDGGSLSTDHAAVIVPAADAPEVGAIWTPPVGGDDEHLDLDRARQIIRTLRDRIVVLEGKATVARDRILAIEARLDALETP